MISTIKWTDNAIRIIDQVKLPHKFEYLYCRDLKTLWDAIRRLSVRGAPALGVAAAYGVVLGMRDFAGTERAAFIRQMEKVCDYIASSRPTAVNLFHGLARMKGVLKTNPAAPVRRLQQRLRAEADAIYEEDRQSCRRMGREGAALIPASGATLLTVCNAGALATVDYGTALGVMYAAKEQEKKFKVYACETRPLLQGARLTAWELSRQKIDVTLICDNMAATVMRQGKIDMIFTGADRIAANGDTANKIGTYSLAVLACHHKIPFYVVAPQSTFDLKTPSGDLIPIEERSKEEVLGFGGQRTAPRRVKVYNPAFDVTEYSLITAFVTEKGIIRAPFAKNIPRILSCPEA